MATVDDYKYHIYRLNPDGSWKLAAWYDTWDKARIEATFLRRHGEVVEIRKNEKEVD